MTANLHDAGLMRPTIFCETPVGAGPDSPLYGWMVRTLRSVLPQLEKIGAATAAEVDIDRHVRGPVARRRVECAQPGPQPNAVLRLDETLTSCSRGPTGCPTLRGLVTPLRVAVGSQGDE